jgi:hypothetical protein
MSTQTRLAGDQYRAATPSMSTVTTAAESRGEKLAQVSDAASATPQGPIQVGFPLVGLTLMQAYTE